jgi:hypothetical protein
MQTFLPYPDFIKSMECLDFKRLNSQCNEARLAIRVIEGKVNGWRNHPVVLQWHDNLTLLKMYHNAAVLVWNTKTKKDGSPVKKRAIFYTPNVNIALPWWIGYEPYHISHRSNLLRKDFNFYNQFDWAIPTDLPYVWPSKIK